MCMLILTIWNMSSTKWVFNNPRLTTIIHCSTYTTTPNIITKLQAIHFHLLTLSHTGVYKGKEILPDNLLIFIAVYFLFLVFLRTSFLHLHDFFPWKESFIDTCN